MPLKSSHYKLIREHFLRLLGNKCALCGSTEKLEFDHIIPNGFGASRGRDIRAWEWFKAYAEGNLQILCKKCNREKSDNQESLTSKDKELLNESLKYNSELMKTLANK